MQISTRTCDEQEQNQFLQGFVEEVRELLDTLNLKLIQLEETPEDEELIDQIFRTVHTIKGSAGFAGLKKISEISRRLEDVFKEVRKGAFKVTPLFIEVIYAALDTLTALMNKPEANDVSEADISSLFKRLDRIFENSPRR
jgi:two-component system chemotaxis sensor kinase CheA